MNNLGQGLLEIAMHPNGNDALKFRDNLVSFCVTDDLDLNVIERTTFVHANAGYGLTQSNAQAVRSLLNEVSSNDEQSK